MSDYTPSLGTLFSAYRRRKPGTSYVMWASQDHVTTTPDAEFDRAIAKVRADAKAEALREAVSDFQHSVGVGEFDEQTRRDGNRHAHIDEAWEYQGPYMDWLLNRADNLEAS